MRLHRFFIEEHLRNKKNVTVFDGEMIHQWKDVFRLRTGDRVILLDNTGFEYLAEVGVLAKGKAELNIIQATVADNVPTKEVWLFASLIKKDNFEWILEKCTELGVSHFVPIISARTEKKDLNMERALKIVREASEQSGRGMLPEVHEPIALEKIFDSETLWQGSTLPLMAFHIEGEKFVAEKYKSFSTSLEVTKIGILVGPEGGWSDSEIALFKEKNIPLYSLGKQVLRAETAAIVVPTLLLL